MTRRGSIFLSTANEIGSALVTKLGGSGYSPKEWGKKANIMGIASEDIPDALANLTPSAVGGDRGSIESTLANAIGAVLNKKFQAERGFKPKEWASAISKLTPLQVKTASGAIASFSDGADAVPLTSLIANIDPKQDLHGYSKPWAPGAGSNIWDEETELGSIDGSGNLTPSTTMLRSKNYIPVVGGATYYFYFQSAFVTHYWDANDNYLSYNYRSSNGAYSVPADAAKMKFRLVDAYGTVYQHDIAINYPSSVTTYSPYSNVCPIEGSTETTAYQFGGNVRQSVTDYSSTNPSFTQYRNYYAGDPCGYPRLTGTFKPGTYTLSFDTDYSGFDASRVCLWVKRKSDSAWYNASSNGDLVAPTNQGYRSWCSGSTHITGTFKINEECEALGFGYYSYGVRAPYSNLMLEIGSTAHAYEEPKSKTPVTVSFGRTVYGGNVDVVNSRLALTYALETYTDASAWSTTSAGYHYITLPSEYRTTGTPIINIYKGVSQRSYTQLEKYEGAISLDRNYLNIYDDRYTDNTSWGTYLANNNLQICFPLETPIEIDLEDPHEVESYLGVNNIYNDTGNTSASYYADIDLDNA